jgi:hypothetical protein
MASMTWMSCGARHSSAYCEPSRLGAARESFVDPRSEAMSKMPKDALKIGSPSGSPGTGTLASHNCSGESAAG